MIQLIRDLWAFARVHKKMWLAPVFIALVVLGSLLIFVQSSAVAPAIYALF